MNIQHLQYLVALADFGHYGDAAEHCHISQPALSMAIRTLEQNLGLSLINRQSKPIALTPHGEIMYEQAKKILFEHHSMLSRLKGENAQHCVLRLGVLPTIAPYLLSRFVEHFLKECPETSLSISEMRTDTLISALKKDQLDVAILATPFEVQGINFQVLYYEELFVLSDKVQGKQYIYPSEIDTNSLWLLEEGHCFRNQVINLCELTDQRVDRISYKAGSIESLVNLVDNYRGIAILPELSTLNLGKRNRQRIAQFHPPAPVREISLAFHPYATHKVLIEQLGRSICAGVPPHMLESRTEVLKVTT